MITPTIAPPTNLNLMSLYNKHSALLRQIELKWITKSREQWVQGGDKNTKYFHTSTLVRRRRNLILSLRLENGDTIEDINDIKTAFAMFYNDIWRPPPPYDASSLSWTWIPSVPMDCHDDLIKLFSDTEIRNVLWSMPLGKATGPDGFHVEFFRHYWNHVGPAVCKALRDFQSSACMPPSWNRTHVALIPKKLNPSRVTDYKPFSLCNVIYRLLTKILTSRLKPLLPSIINPEQSAFVAGRNIGNNIILAQEIVHSVNTVGRRGLIC